MSRAARSLFLFGAYVFLVGVALLAAPDALAFLLRLPPATTGWVRVVGLLALVIGAYDMVSSRGGCLPTIRASVPVRFGFAAGTALLVLSRQMPLSVLLLGLTDAAGAVWTAVALRSDQRSVVSNQ